MYSITTEFLLNIIYPNVCHFSEMLKVALGWLILCRFFIAIGKVVIGELTLVFTELKMSHIAGFEYALFCYDRILVYGVMLSFYSDAAPYLVANPRSFLFLIYWAASTGFILALLNQSIAAVMIIAVMTFIIICAQMVGIRFFNTCGYDASSWWNLELPVLLRYHYTFCLCSVIVLLYFETVEECQKWLVRLGEFFSNRFAHVEPLEKDHHDLSFLLALRSVIFFSTMVLSRWFSCSFYVSNPVTILIPALILLFSIAGTIVYNVTLCHYKKYNEQWLVYPEYYEILYFRTDNILALFMRSLNDDMTPIKHGDFLFKELPFVVGLPCLYISLSVQGKAV